MPTVLGDMFVYFFHPDFSPLIFLSLTAWPLKRTGSENTSQQTHERGCLEQTEINYKQHWLTTHFFGGTLVKHLTEPIVPHGSVRSDTCVRNLISKVIQILKSHLTSGALLEVAASQKCTQLQCEAHFDVKMVETSHVRVTFGFLDVEKVRLHTFGTQNASKTSVPYHFEKLRI